MFRDKTILFYVGTGVAALLLVFGILYWFAGFAFIALFEAIFRSLFHIILPIAIGAIVAGGSYFLLRDRSGQVIIPGIILGVSILGSLAYSALYYGYAVESTYASAAKSVEETTQYADRAPWVVANNYAQRNQEDIIGDRMDAHYVPAPADKNAAQGEGSSRYTVIIDGKAFLGMTGYAGIQTLNMPVTGNMGGGVSSYCETPDGMDKRIGNIWRSHNLTVDISKQRANAHFNPDDVYGYCDGDSPKIVIPLYEYDGLWTVTKAPAGVAVYDKTGVKVYDADEVKSLNIQGPTYPRSLASKERESINASGSWSQWIAGNYGYDTTNKDDDDSNGENSTEFTMIDGSGAMDYVTPLTPRGTSQSITATGYVKATQDGSNRNPLIVNKSTQLPATSTLVTSIKESSVNGDSQWATRWSAGMKVYEILPGKEGHWVASIGQGQAVSYRADIAPDGSVTVTNADTGATSSHSEPSPTAQQSATVPGTKPLDQMSDAELLVQIQTATEELQRRQNGN